MGQKLYLDWIFAVGLTVVGGLLGQWAWGLVVPDVFVEAVEKGVLPASITFTEAMKLTILISFLSSPSSVYSWVFPRSPRFSKK